MCCNSNFSFIRIHIGYRAYFVESLPGAPDGSEYPAYSDISLDDLWPLLGGLRISAGSYTPWGSTNSEVSDIANNGRTY